MIKCNGIFISKNKIQPPRKRTQPLQEITKIINYANKEMTCTRIGTKRYELEAINQHLSIKKKVEVDER